MNLQQYVEAGTCLYIPFDDNVKRKCNVTHFKHMQRLRNEQILREYQMGIPVIELSKRYFLSKQAIYKILKSSAKTLNS